jgi:hypothetical protein
MKRILTYGFVGVVLCIVYFLYHETIFFADIFSRLSYYLSDNGWYLLPFGIFLESSTNFHEAFNVVFIPAICLGICIALTINTFDRFLGKKGKLLAPWAGLVVVLFFALFFELVLLTRFLPDPGGVVLSTSNYKFIRFWSPIGLSIYALGSFVLDFFASKKGREIR